MSFASAALATAPLAVQEAIADVLLALTSDQAIRFLWKMLFLYVCLLVAWRIGYLFKHMINHRAAQAAKNPGSKKEQKSDS